jgi:hypothetical protein
MKTEKQIREKLKSNEKQSKKKQPYRGFDYYFGFQQALIWVLENKK